MVLKVLQKHFLSDVTQKSWKGPADSFSCLPFSNPGTFRVHLKYIVGCLLFETLSMQIWFEQTFPLFLLSKWQSVIFMKRPDPSCAQRVHLSANVCACLCAPWHSERYWGARPVIAVVIRFLIVSLIRPAPICDSPENGTAQQAAID